jgi:glucosamine-phosphate N-acetyltransferase
MTITLLTRENIHLVNLDKYYDLLRHLSDTITVNDKHLLERLVSCPHIFVFLFGPLDNPQGNITCILEPKIIHDGKCVAHIEDVVVHPELRGQKIASQLVRHVQQFAEERNCYKILLHCHPSLVPFYEIFGFSQHELHGMRYDIVK